MALNFSIPTCTYSTSSTVLSQKIDSPSAGMTNEYSNETKNNDETTVSTNKTQTTVTVIVQPSTVWIPITYTSVQELATSTFEVAELVSVSDAIITIKNVMPSSTQVTNAQSNKTPYDPISEQDLNIPDWLTSSTYVPSTDVLLYYAQEYIITDSTTTFRAELVSRTVVPTWSTFSLPTSVITTDISYYESYLSGSLNSTSDSEDSSNKKKAIIGGVVGGVGGIVLLVALYFFSIVMRKRRGLQLMQEKQFTHSMGRKMTYDDIEELQGHKVSKENYKHTPPFLTTDNCTNISELPITLSHELPQTHFILPSKNPFSDEFELNTNGVRREHQLEKTFPSLDTRFSSSSFTPESDCSSDSALTEGLLPNCRLMTQSYLTELID